VGLSSGYLYVIKQFKDVVVATKAHDENVFLPVDIDKIVDFMDSNTLDQRLNYMVSNTTLSTVHSLNANFRIGRDYQSLSESQVVIQKIQTTTHLLLHKATALLLVSQHLLKITNFLRQHSLRPIDPQTKSRNSKYIDHIL
ncbi:hypothetical protein FB192DRAFT_1281842, partial [Mucor lusitanicus]